jgi:hypothetical protein
MTGFLTDFLEWLGLVLFLTGVFYLIAIVFI